jgi:hypothetical protein
VARSSKRKQISKRKPRLYRERYLANGLADLTYIDRHGKRTAGLDIGIEHYVLKLREQGVETCQSCQGGPGHAYLEPTIEFYGNQSAGPKAVGAALTYDFPVAELRREWSVRDGEMHGPIWTMTFRVRADVWIKREAERTAAYFKRCKTGRDAC